MFQALCEVLQEAERGERCQGPPCSQESLSSFLGLEGLMELAVLTAKPASPSPQSPLLVGLENFHPSFTSPFLPGSLSCQLSPPPVGLD